MARVDYDDMGPRYREGRGLTLEGLAGWRDAVAPWVEAAGDGPVLDLGAGAGNFALAFAAWFGGPVVAVEPAAGMRAAALKAGIANLVAGDASRIPLRAASCALAWLSTVIHHFPDLAVAAAEVRRVVRPGGPVLIRSSFPGRHQGISLFRYFPAAGRVAGTFPTVDETVAAFEAAGFAFASLEAVPQVSAPSLSAAVQRVRLRADTTLTLISDEEFAAGLAALEAAAARPEADAPVVDHIDLLVLR